MNTQTKNTSCGCSTTIKAKTACPTCNRKGTKISELTLKMQVKKEHYKDVKSDKNSFNFCTSPHCDTVYYSDESSESFNQKEVKYKVAPKNNDLDTPLCYCKQFKKKDAIKLLESTNINVAGKIKEIISGGCKCEKTHPKGVSCIEDITHFLKPYDIDFEQESSSCCNSSSTKKDSTSMLFTKKKSSCCS